MTPKTREEQLLNNIISALTDKASDVLSPTSNTEKWLINIDKAIRSEELLDADLLVHEDIMYYNIVNAITDGVLLDEPVLTNEDTYLKAIADKFGGDSTELPAARTDIELYYADIYENIGGGGRLPAGYTELDYIESTGTQYIVTDTIPSEHANKLRITTKVYQIAKQDSTSYIVGQMNGGTLGRFCNITLSRTEFNVVGGGSTARVLFSGLGEKGAPVLRTWYDIDVTVIDGSTESSLKINDWTFAPIGAESKSSGKCSLLTIGTAGSRFIGRMCETAFADPTTGEDIQRFVPCKNPQDEYGMYDLVSKTFYGNAGDGEFTGGNIEGTQLLSAMFMNPPTDNNDTVQE